MRTKRDDYGPVALFGYYDDNDESGKAVIYLEGSLGDENAVVIVVPRRLCARLPYEDWPGAKKINTTKSSPEGA